MADLSELRLAYLLLEFLQRRSQKRPGNLESRSASRRSMGTTTRKGRPEYGISAVALGKVCDKLQIPLPGRGYQSLVNFNNPVPIF
jgi:hypothetical protein